MPTAKRIGKRIAWDYASKTSANKNAKDLKKAGAKDVKVDPMNDKLGRRFYRLSARV